MCCDKLHLAVVNGNLNLHLQAAESMGTVTNVHAIPLQACRGPGGSGCQNF